MWHVRTLNRINIGSLERRSDRPVIAGCCDAGHCDAGHCDAGCCDAGVGAVRRRSAGRVRSSLTHQSLASQPLSTAVSSQPSSTTSIFDTDTRPTWNLQSAAPVCSYSRLTSTSARRPCGRPRTSWLSRATDTDVQSVNIGIHSAWSKASDRARSGEYYRRHGNTPSWGTPLKNRPILIHL